MKVGARVVTNDEARLQRIYHGRRRRGVITAVGPRNLISVLWDGFTLSSTLNRYYVQPDAAPSNVGQARSAGADGDPQGASGPRA